MSKPRNTESITRLGPLSGGASAASIELVELGGRRYVLKRSSPARAAGERRFHEALAVAGLGSLAVATHPSLGPGDLLLEYVEGSRALWGLPLADACRLWGAAVAGMHGLRFDRFMRVDSAGEVVGGSWAAFVERLIDRALVAGRTADLPVPLIEKAETKLGDLRGFTPGVFALTHGDLHGNNVLLRVDEAVLFDKAARVWASPPVFDLALIHSEGFPGARYGALRPRDDDRLAAFMAAYGDIPDADWLDHFALVHGLMRYPSPFVPDLRQIIEAVLARL